MIFKKYKTNNIRLSTEPQNNKSSMTIDAKSRNKTKPPSGGGTNSNVKSKLNKNLVKSKTVTALNSKLHMKKQKKLCQKLLMVIGKIMLKKKLKI